MKYNEKNVRLIYFLWTCSVTIIIFYIWQFHVSPVLSFKVWKKQLYNLGDCNVFMMSPCHVLSLISVFHLHVCSVHNPSIILAVIS